MKSRALVLSFLLIGAGLVGPGASISMADGAQHGSSTAVSRVCTKTSSGKCIKGGQFCPKAKYGRNGYDAKGRRYVCKGSHSHPHWMKP